MGINDEKRAIRDRVWRLLERENASPPGTHGKIPTFAGADQTAEVLAGLDFWRESQSVKANPDNSQLPVRIQALRDGKLLYMAVPRMASLRPFYMIDPASLDLPIEEAADKNGAARLDRRVSVQEMRSIDLVVCGSVAVNRSGARIGKGAGYSDLEVALLIEAGLVTDDTVIVAPVHRLQVIDDEIPESQHDFRVDFIVTPEEVIPCPSPYRPHGIVWKDLTPEIIQAIPVLAARKQPNHRANQ